MIVISSAFLASELFRTSRVPVLTVRSEFVISSHPVCGGFTLEKGVRERERKKEYIVYTRGCGPSAFLPFRMRRVRIRCTAAGTKTPCRTITLNKSLHPIAVRRGVLRWLFMPTLLSKQDQNDRRQRPVRNSSPEATPSSPIIENFKGDPIVSAGQMTRLAVTKNRDPTPLWHLSGRK